MSAKERKAKIREARQATAKPVGRRSSRMKVTFVTPQKKTRRVATTMEPVWKVGSAQGRFDDLRPANVHPYDWHKLYVEDEELWPMLVEAAQEAIEDGELQPYERSGRNGS